MASTSYLSRVIIKDHTASQSDFKGTYTLLANAKSIGSPIGTPNTVESTTLEDNVQTFEAGILTSDSIEITANFEKAQYQAINGHDGLVDLVFLYGTTGTGDQLAVGRTGKVIATPSDVGGVDEILEMTITFIPSTIAEDLTSSTITEESGTFTIA